MRRLRKAWRAKPLGHSEEHLVRYKDIVIKIVPQGYDNCGFILWNDKSGANECVLIDVYDAKAFIVELKSLKKIPTVVLSTHWHWDHCGGNRALLNEYPNVQVYGGKYEPVSCATVRVDHADEIVAAGLNFSVELVPGHTSGQVVYRLHISPEGPDCLFTGDFLFVGGTGKLFEGTDARLLSSLLAVKSWQPNSLIFPGHEFAKENLEFALTIEPDNVELSDKYVDVCDLRLVRLPAMPTTLGDEFEYNPFLRLGEESIVKGLENLGYTVPPAKTHKGRTRLDSDVVDFNRKVDILRILRKAKEDYDSRKSKKDVTQSSLQRA